MKTTILLDHEPVPGGHVVRALLKLEGDVVAVRERPPINLSLVLDRSGSMSGEKLHAAREAAALLVRRLAPADVVSVVAYDDRVRTVADPAGGAAQADLSERIRRIEAGGSTNLSGGWLRGRELLARNRIENGVNRVILLTDGLANVGIIEPERLLGLAATGARDGITTTTIGFGEDYDETLLRGMADAGRGNTYYIEAADQAAAIFNDELQGLLEIAAQNLRVEIRPQAATSLAAVHHEYPRVAAADGALALELGDLYPREPKSLLCEFLVSDVADAAPRAVALLVITADVIEADGVAHTTLELPITVSLAEGPRVDPEVRRELLLLEAARVRREALADEREGNFEQGRARLQALHDKLAAAGVADAELREQAEDIAPMVASFQEATVSESDRKYLYQQAYNISTSRRTKQELIRRRKK
jgi:Ca-activated chloride channel family protein